MRNRSVLIFIPFVLVANLAAQSEPTPFPRLTGPYLGQKRPGKTPEPLAPEVPQLCTSLHSMPTFSPDGQEAFWPEGFQPPYPLMTSRVVHGVWTPPVRASVSLEGIGDDSPFLSPDGKRLFFLSSRSVDPPTRRGDRESIWVCERNSTGWSEPKPLPRAVNELHPHWQVSMDRQGNLYFGASSGGPSVGGDIYVAKYVDGAFAIPEKLPASVNAKDAYTFSPCIAPDGDYLLFSRQVSRAFSSYVIFRRPDGTWTEAKPLAEALQVPGAHNVRVTADGKYLIFAGPRLKPYWMDASFLGELRKEALLAPH